MLERWLVGCYFAMATLSVSNRCFHANAGDLAVFKTRGKAVW